MISLAIVKFVNSSASRSAGGMRGAMNYVTRADKTVCGDRHLITGVNCQAKSAYRDFMLTKEQYHKTDGTMFYHLVQSFPKGEQVDPDTAHAAAVELADHYRGHEVLVCTHTDRDHVHSHLIINSVNFDTGRKLHVGSDHLQELRQVNDGICRHFQLPVFEPQKPKRTKAMTTAEYHVAERGQSKKLQLMNVVNHCMRLSANREEFIERMEGYGYGVRWEESRKNITYTTPTGWQCRDRMLFGDKYLKENMEYEFKLRAELIHGRAAETEQPDLQSSAADPAPADAAALHRGGPVPHGRNSHADVGADEKYVSAHPMADQVPETDRWETVRLRHLDADGGAAGSPAADRMDAGTGWETERAAFFDPQAQEADTLSAVPGDIYRSDQCDADPSMTVPVGRSGNDHGLPSLNPWVVDVGFLACDIGLTCLKIMVGWDDSRDQRRKNSYIYSTAEDAAGAAIGLMVCLTVVAVARIMECCDRRAEAKALLRQAEQGGVMVKEADKYIDAVVPKLEEHGLEMKNKPKREDPIWEMTM